MKNPLGISPLFHRLLYCSCLSFHVFYLPYRRGQALEVAPLLPALRAKPIENQQSHSFVIQAVSFKDYPSLKQLALKHPLLNLPAEENLLKEKIKVSQKSFSETLTMEKRNFVFVLKTKEGEVIGSSQIASKSGTPNTPSYSLKIYEENKEGKKKKPCHLAEKNQLRATTSHKIKSGRYKYLKLRKITNGPSYLGGLILHQDYRGHIEKAGKQLSLIRFLFAGIYPHFFKNTFHAEVAPFLNAQGKNPFFEQFIKKHISLSMPEIDYLTLTNKEKLFANYPKGKISFSSLPKEVQKSIGKPGLFSQRAGALLKKQNFRFVEEVDPFDGGPYMQAQAKKIPVIQGINKVYLKKNLNNLYLKTKVAFCPAG